MRTSGVIPSPVPIGFQLSTACIGNNLYYKSIIYNDMGNYAKYTPFLSAHKAVALW